MSRPSASDNPRAAVRTVKFAVPFSYPVWFERNTFAPTNSTLIQLLSAAPGARRARVVCLVDAGLIEARPELVGHIHAYFEHHAERAELLTEVQSLPGGEHAKRDSVVLEEAERLLAVHHVDRHSYCLAVGGGAFLDVVGFAAATVHRGVRLVRMPSTVLSQNDAGIGVKNGINAFGQKNFLGTFAPPFAVINDVNFLHSLSGRDRRAGMAEAIKVALIRDVTFFEWLCDNSEALNAFELDAVSAMVRRAAELHLYHIETGGDPFEAGSSRPLDFGHWAAHKLEGMTQHSLRHGEAVAIGIALDTLYSAARGWLPSTDAERVVGLIEALGLPTYHPALSRRGTTGELEVERGLSEFREHLGGELSVTFLSALGAGVTHNEVDVRLVRLIVDKLACREQPRANAVGAP
jgi:3-dehydroquinate synthase